MAAPSKPPQPPLLVSAHLPKTAGTSFGRALDEHFGRPVERFSDRPLLSSGAARKAAVVRGLLRNLGREYRGIACFHGHLYPAQFLTVRLRRRVRFVTWLREPFERLVSHYRFWTGKLAESRVPLVRRVIDEGWTLERFCLSAEVRNLYATYLWGFPHRSLDFVGITEHYEEEMAWFAREILSMTEGDVSHAIHRENVGSSAPVPGAEELRARVRQYHARDYALYEWALHRRAERLAVEASSRRGPDAARLTRRERDG